jgi:broad specificity phosphatase PhoE
VTPGFSVASSAIALPESFIIYLARHATPDRTRPEIIYHTPPGPALNERGLQEAEQLADFLHDMGVVAMLSSPFERTRQTAQIAIRETGASLDFDPDLGERQPIESEVMVTERMLRAFVSGAQRAAQHGPLAIFTHGAPVMTLLKALGLPVTALERCRIYDNRNPIPMAGAWRIERLDGSLTIRPVFAPLGIALPNFPAKIIEKESP